MKGTFVKAPTAHLVVFTAIGTALAYILNMIAIPVGPHINLIFGDIVAFLIVMTLGPLWGVIAGCVSKVYTIILWGHPWAVFTTFFHAIACAYLARRIRPFWAFNITTWFVYIPIMYPTHIFGSGYPVWLMHWIAVKVIANNIFDGFIIELLLALPVVQKLIPGWKPPEKVGLFFWKPAPIE